jgi:hypothetical protein
MSLQPLRVGPLLVAFDEHTGRVVYQQLEQSYSPVLVAALLEIKGLRKQLTAEVTAARDRKECGLAMLDHATQHLGATITALKAFEEKLK